MRNSNKINMLKIIKIMFYKNTVSKAVKSVDIQFGIIHEVHWLSKIKKDYIIFHSEKIKFDQNIKFDYFNLIVKCIK